MGDKMGSPHLKSNRTPEQLATLPIVGAQPESEAEEKFLREICKFEFVNIEEPGAPNVFSYGNTRNGHRFYLMHGGKYDLPRFVARHVESCQKPLYKWRPDGLGAMQKELVGSEPRFQMRQLYGK